jgi:carboxypeptidase D
MVTCSCHADIFLSLAIMSWPVVNVIPALDFVHKYEHVFSLKYVSIHGIEAPLTLYSSQTFLKQLDETAKKCHYAGYMEKYVTYPPKGPFPLPGKNTSAVPGCDVWTDILDAALLINPGFNTYRIFDMYPILWDMLGFP